MRKLVENEKERKKKYGKRKISDVPTNLVDHFCRTSITLSNIKNSCLHKILQDTN